MGKYRDQVERLHRERQQPRTLSPRYNGAGEAEVVPGYQLAPILRAWVKEWLAERPRNAKPMGEESFGNSVAFVGPVQWLAERTGINIRRVSGIINEEFVVVPLSQADLLLCAIEENGLLATGAIQIVPNPNWSNERWIAYMEGHGCA